MNGIVRPRGWKRHCLGGGIVWERFCGVCGSGGSAELCQASGDLLLWLNVAGDGLIWGTRERFLMKPGMYALTGGRGEASWKHVRQAGEHRLERIQLNFAWLEDHLGGGGWSRTPEHLAARFFDGSTVAFCGLMGVWEKDLCGALDVAAGGGLAERLQAQARILEWVAARLVRARVEPPATLREREGAVGVALAHLRGHFAGPLDLASLARLAGVSAPHLCRIVKAATGQTLLQHQRRLRIAHACETLASGRANVTEAALDCGYQNLSHFSKAFREETGLTPREWLARKPATGK